MGGWVGLSLKMVRQILIVFLTLPLLLNLIYKFLAAKHQKLLHLQNYFEDCEWVHFSLLNFIPSSLLVATFPKFSHNSVEKRQAAALRPAAFLKSSVQIQEVYQPIGGGELQISVIKRVFYIQNALVLSG